MPFPLSFSIVHFHASKLYKPSFMGNHALRLTLYKAAAPIEADTALVSFN